MFFPAELKAHSWRWYISFRALNPITGKLESFRKTYDMNRIKNLKERRSFAMDMVNRLNKELLPSGYPFEDPDFKSILEAIDEALEVKRELPRKKSFQSIKSKANILKTYLEEKRLGKLDITEWDRTHCRRFMAWVLETRGVSNTTYNTYINQLKTMWMEMVRDKLIGENPWRDMKMKIPEEKKRRILTDGERVAIIQEAKENDWWLYLAILLQYYCFIRPSELRRLLFRDFDLGKGTVTLSREKTKTHRRGRVLTMPSDVLKVFHHQDFVKNPGNWVVFGKSLKPHPNKPCGQNTMSNRHRLIVQKLFEEGKISHMDGLQFYSWKDTGITNLSQQVSPYKLREQTGHVDFEMLLRYYHNSDVNQEMKKVRVDVL